VTKTFRLQKKISEKECKLQVYLHTKLHYVLNIFVHMCLLQMVWTSNMRTESHAKLQMCWKRLEAQPSITYILFYL